MLMCIRDVKISLCVKEVLNKLRIKYCDTYIFEEVNVVKYMNGMVSHVVSIKVV